MDTDLIGRAQHGDEEAFASLAVRVGDRLHAVAFRILRDTALAEDASQQALLTIWRDLPQLRDPARFDAWSYRLLVRACYTEGRRWRCARQPIRTARSGYGAHSTRWRWNGRFETRLGPSAHRTGPHSWL